MINIKFNTTNVLRTLIHIRENISIKALLKVYMMRINKENILFDKDLIFICNAQKLDKNDASEISHPNINIGNNSGIIVFDGKYRILTYI